LEGSKEGALDKVKLIPKCSSKFRPPAGPVGKLKIMTIGGVLLVQRTKKKKVLGWNVNKGDCSGGNASGGKGIGFFESPRKNERKPPTPFAKKKRRVPT